jgi:hypothetical protein
LFHPHPVTLLLWSSSQRVTFEPPRSWLFRAVHQQRSEAIAHELAQLTGAASSPPSVSSADQAAFADSLPQLLAGPVPQLQAALSRAGACPDPALVAGLARYFDSNLDLLAKLVTVVCDGHPFLWPNLVSTRAAVAKVDTLASANATIVKFFASVPESFKS